MDGTVSIDKVNSNLYEKDIEILYDKVNIISIVTDDGKTQVYEVRKVYEPPVIKNPIVGVNNGTPRAGHDLDIGTIYNEVQYKFTWDDISEIAEAISNTLIDDDTNNNISNTVSEFEISYGGINYVLGVGDRMRINGNTVRIIGFNHDDLVNKAVYGGTNTKAGITFEYEKYLIKDASLHSSAWNVNWGICTLRASLNSTYYDILKEEIGQQTIKQVKKTYIQTYNSSSLAVANDYLWLLSNAEIWNNKGYAIAKEGNQYKYYAMVRAYYDTANSYLYKGVAAWWLRSPYYDNNYRSCLVWPESCTYSNANGSHAVPPCFCV